MTTVAEDAAQPRRLRLPFVAALLGAAAGLVMHLAWPSGGATQFDGEKPLPTAAQARPAMRLAASLPTPPGAVRDRYDTACHYATPYCITSTTRSAADLMNTVRRLLVARGASPLDSSRLRFDGVLIGVHQSPSISVREIQQPVAVAVVVAAQSAARRSRSLGPWRHLGLAPTAWGVPKCITRARDGCHHYSDTLTVHESFDAVRQFLSTRIQALGLSMELARCRRISCAYAGSKFRSLGGRDQMSVMVLVHDISPSVTSVRFMVDALDTPAINF